MHVEKGCWHTLYIAAEVMALLGPYDAAIDMPCTICSSQLEHVVDCCRRNEAASEGGLPASRHGTRLGSCSAPCAQGVSPYDMIPSDLQHMNPCCCWHINCQNRILYKELIRAVRISHLGESVHNEGMNVTERVTEQMNEGTSERVTEQTNE